MSALSIGKVVKHLLVSSASVDGIVGKNIYPIVVPVQINGPLIAYARASIVGNETKDGLYEEVANVEVTCACESYESAIELAEAARLAIENKTGLIKGLDINSSKMIDADEDFQDGIYTQSLLFEFKIEN